MLPVIVLCGGLAKRMRPLTNDRPKSLIPINGEPFIFHQLRLLKRQGIMDVVLCVGFLGEQIEAAVGNGEACGVNVRYVYEGDQLLGTGGAVINVGEQLPAQFFMMYGDSYLTCNFQAVEASFQESEGSALMTVYHNQDRFDSSNVIYKNSNIEVYSKVNKTPAMQHIDYGLSCFNKSVFDGYTQGQIIDLADIYIELIKQNQLAGFEVSQRFYEIGSFAGKKEFETLTL